MTEVLSFCKVVMNKVNKINPIHLAIILFIIFLGTPLVTYNLTYPGGADLWKYLSNPFRVLNGELPYRDFWLIFPPGHVFFPALIYKVFGLNINIVLTFSVLISALVGLFSFLVGKLIFKNNSFATATAILVFFVGVPTNYEGYTYPHMDFLLILVATAFFLRYLKNNAHKELFLTGIFAGLASLFRFEIAGAISLSFFLIVIIRQKFDKKPLTYGFKLTGVFLAGILIILAITSLALINIWQPMMGEVIVESVSHHSTEYVPYFATLFNALDGSITNLQNAIDTHSFFSFLTFGFDSVLSLVLFVLYLCPFLVTGFSIYFLVRGNLKKEEKTIVIFLLLWGIFTMPRVLTRGNVGNLVYATTPLFFLLMFLILKGLKSVDKISIKRITRILIVVAIVLSLSVPLSFINTSYILSKPHYEIRTERGHIFFENESEARDVNSTINFINQNTKDGDYIFITPDFASPIYALTNRRNPTYYDTLFDLIIRPSYEKQKRIIDDLKNTKLIIHYPDEKFLKACPILQEFIENQFTLINKYGNYWIYVPNSVP